MTSKIDSYRLSCGKGAVREGCTHNYENFYRKSPGAGSVLSTSTGFACATFLLKNVTFKYLPKATKVSRFITTIKYAI